MAERKPEWPEDGDLVIATIETVTDYGAYIEIGGQSVFRRDK
jgi:translation initiation factor 2 alpha subunit (eIF-2alpha)